MELKRILLVTALSAGGSFLMSACLSWLHRRYVDPLPFPNKELAGDVHQTRVVLIDCPPDQSIRASRSALLSLPRIKLRHSAGRRLEARTGVTFRTLGEVIVIRAEAAEDGKSRLAIESRPRWSGPAVDYGKSYENVERIFAHLARSHPVTLASANVPLPN